MYIELSIYYIDSCSNVLENKHGRNYYKNIIVR